MTTPKETRERVARLEEQSIAAANDRVDIKKDIKETRADVVALVVGQKGLDIKFDHMEEKQDDYATKLDNHFADLRKSNGKGRKIEAGITGGGLAGILGAIAAIIKWWPF